MPMALLKVIGKDSMASLSVEENMGFHCRSILTQMMINGQSRAEKKTMIDTDTQFRAKVIASCAEIEQLWRDRRDDQSAASTERASSRSLTAVGCLAWVARPKET